MLNLKELGDTSRIPLAEFQAGFGPNAKKSLSALAPQKAETFILRSRRSGNEFTEDNQVILSFFDALGLLLRSHLYQSNRLKSFRPASLSTDRQSVTLGDKRNRLSTFRRIRVADYSYSPVVYHHPVTGQMIPDITRVEKRIRDPRYGGSKLEAQVMYCKIAAETGELASPVETRTYSPELRTRKNTWVESQRTVLLGTLALLYFLTDDLSLSLIYPPADSYYVSKKSGVSDLAQIPENLGRATTIQFT